MDIKPFEYRSYSDRLAGQRRRYANESREARRRRNEQSKACCERIKAQPDVEIVAVEKKCSDCERILPVGQFSKRKQSKDGLAYKCKSCQSIFHEKWRESRTPKPHDIIIETYGAGIAPRSAATRSSTEFRCVRTFVFQKKCKQCKEEKPSAHFYTDKYTKDGKSPYCRECRVDQGAQLAARRKVGEARRGHGRSIIQDGEKRCPRCKSFKPFAEFYRAKSSKTGLMCQCKKCHDKVFEIDGKLELNLLSSMRKSVARAKNKGQPTKWESILGYSFRALRQHIESRFVDGMTWNLFLSGKIQIDHIVPRAAFYYETIYEQEFKDCWALTNLQPLWKTDNRQKSDKMPDGTSGRHIGVRKEELYEARLAQMAAGCSEISSFLV